MATFDSARANRLIFTASRISQHRPPGQNDLDYWIPKFEFAFGQDGESGIDYMYQRCLGQGAGGADIPPYGPYGRDTTSSSPAPYPEELVPTPTPTPVPIPIPIPIPTPEPIPVPPVVAVDLTEVVISINRIATILEKTAARFGIK
jgi:hypothetical protein